MFLCATYDETIFVSPTVLSKLWKALSEDFDA
jgi:hypothetical protein